MSTFGARTDLKDKAQNHHGKEGEATGMTDLASKSVLIGKEANAEMARRAAGTRAANPEGPSGIVEKQADEEESTEATE